MDPIYISKVSYFLDKNDEFMLWSVILGLSKSIHVPSR